MSLLRALNTGTSGLQSSTLQLDVVGDNIANANTIGFKGGRAAFQDALYQQMIGMPGNKQVGLGTALQAIQRIITQGALANTGLATDLALDGNGFFVVKGNHNGTQGQFYTRAGQFTVDKDGYLTNLDGLRVQGYAQSQTNNSSSSLTDMQVGNANSPATATSNITLKANLDANADATLPPFDPANPTATSNHKSQMTIYDSLGAPHSVDVYWRRTGAGTWEWNAMADGGGLVGGTAGTAQVIANGTATFDTQGRLTNSTQASAFQPLGAVTPQALTFNFGNDTTSGGTGLDGITQFASQSATTFTGQDGHAFGALSSVQINNKGEVLGAFSNGESRVLGQVAVADFEAADQMRRIGGNLMMQSTDSGEPTIGAPSSGGRAAIVAGALEQSNVDLADEFITMIAAQRGFQANSKTITTADQMLTELMTLKR